MFISSEHWDEEVFPLGYFIVFSLNNDFEEYEGIRPLKMKNLGFFSMERKVPGAKSDGRSKQNEYKAIEKSVRDICRCMGYHLRAAKIIDGQILLVISNQLNPKTKFNSGKNGIDLQSLSTKILSNAKELRRLEKSFCLWKNQQINAAIDYIKNGKGNLEFDLP